MKGDKEAHATPFHDRKGVKSMKPSSFQETIENQFDYICKQVIEDERKDYFKHLDRLSAKEVSFSDIDNYLVNSFSTVDTYVTDFQLFKLFGLRINVESDLLSEALRHLSEKKRNIILLHYFMDMSDVEIAELLNLNRSTVYRHRISGLAMKILIWLLMKPYVAEWKRNSSLRFYRSKLNSPIFSWKRVESYPRFPIWEVCYSIKAYCVFSRF